MRRISVLMVSVLFAAFLFAAAVPATASAKYYTKITGTSSYTGHAGQTVTVSGGHDYLYTRTNTWLPLTNKKIVIYTRTNTSSAWAYRATIYTRLGGKWAQNFSLPSRWSKGRILYIKLHSPRTSSTYDPNVGLYSSTVERQIKVN